MVETTWTDEIFFEEATNVSLEIEGLEIPGGDNLLLRTLRLARTITEIPPLKIRLKKSIPMGAGLGGGSSDAAKFYVALADQYFPGRDPKQLEHDISSIGSDCAFFIKGNTQFCTGRGEVLEPIALNLKGKHCLIINIGIHISTPEAFSLITPNAHRKSIKEIVAQPIEGWRKELHNDFETSAFKLYPVLAEIKKTLYQKGAVYAAMTGSGSTMFGIFESIELAEKLTTEFDDAKFVKLVSF